MAKPGTSSVPLTHIQELRAEYLTLLITEKLASNIQTAMLRAAAMTDFTLTGHIIGLHPGDDAQAPAPATKSARRLSA